MKKLVLFLSLYIPLITVAQQVAPSAARNYSHKIVYKKGYSAAIVNNATNDQKIETIQYYDGLGRPIQIVAVRQGGKDSSNNDSDLINHITYDDYGRQVIEYLPVPSSDNNGKYNLIDTQTDINTYYDARFPNEWTSSSLANPYSEKLLEDSPLNRLVQQGAPGEHWKIGGGHEIEFDYSTNTSSTEVRLYTVSFTNNNPELPNLVTSGYYPIHSLFKNIVYDENHSSGTNHSSEEFKDKQGRVILKRTYATIDGTSATHDTYYVYDNFGNLTYVLAPKSDATANQPDSTELDELCYQYKYDQRNRLINRKIPGKGWKSIVYNLTDQPVMTQDSILYTQNKWLFTKYDVYGRVAYSGIKSTPNTQSTFQSYADNPNSYTQYETQQSSFQAKGGVNLYYNNVAIPTTMTDITTVNYYDNYDFLGSENINVPSTNYYGASITTNTKGLVTGTKVRVLDTNDWITTVTAYDEHNRAIWTYTQNDFLNTTDIIESKLVDYTDDISGRVYETKTTHKKTNKSDIVTIEKFDYDHAGKLLIHTHNINDLGDESIATNEYDALGQLIRKKVGNDQSTSSELQVVDYTYNIRGWLKGINDVNNLGSTDLFAFKINYNNPTIGVSLFNGNISQTFWKTANSDNSLKNYNYTYDALNRITGAIDDTGNYNLTSVAYDKNGNITNIERKGHTNIGATSFGVMDNLVYTYEANSNKLKKVLDNGNDTFGFKDGVNQTTEFTYDVNGNLKSDANKGITSVQYNHLNMPTKITVTGTNTGVLDYVYTANGTKLQKKKTVGGNITTTDYASGYIYENNILKQFNQPEGYIELDGSGYQYVYRLKDIWGNTRITFSDDNSNGSVTSSEIRKEQNYYPFGLEHQGYNNSSYGVENNLKTYQGQEFTKDLQLNTHEWKYRMSDPAIGRFWQIDPLSEDYTYNSTYAFQENKMGLGIELEGAELLKNGTGWFKLKLVHGDKLKIDINNRNVPSVYKNSDDSPKFSPGSVGIGSKGLFSKNETSIRPSNNLPDIPKFDMNASGQGGVSVGVGPIADNLKSVNAKGVGALTLGRKWIKTFSNDLPIWKAQGALNENIFKFDKAIGVLNNSTFTGGEIISNGIKADLTNFIFDGTLPANTNNSMPSFIPTRRQFNTMIMGMDLMEQQGITIQKGTQAHFNALLKYFGKQNQIKP